MSIEVKICGINDAQALRASVNHGARYVGFVFYAPSRNAISAEDSHKLAMQVPPSVTKTGLFVDAGDDELRAVTGKVPLDLLQLHGNETPQRVAAIRAFTGLPVMVAIRIQSAEDLQKVTAFEAVADKLMFDSRVSAAASGGPIDWSLLKGRTFKKPWLLAGGLNAQNLAEAVKASGAKAVDVSSGTEDRPGHKDPEKIRAFLEVAGRIRA